MAHRGCVCRGGSGGPGLNDGQDPQVRVLDLDSPYKAVVQIEFAQPPEAQLELTRTDFDNAIAWQEDDK